MASPILVGVDTRVPARKLMRRTRSPLVIEPRHGEGGLSRLVAGAATELPA